MVDAFCGEIRLFPLDYDPEYWLMCDGRTLYISQYQALFSLIGVNFGGNTQQGTFKLPNLQGYVVAHNAPANPDFTYAHTTGQNTVAITPYETPQHTHSLVAKVSSALPTGMTSQAGANGASLLSRTMSSAIKPFYAFGTDAGTATDTAMSISNKYGGPTGAALAHDNMMPTLAMNYFICIDGIYPDPE